MFTYPRMTTQTFYPQETQLGFGLPRLIIIIAWASLFFIVLAYNSRKSYSTAIHRYIHFCKIFHLYPLELSETRILRFIAYLASVSLQVSTIKVWQGFGPGLSAWVALHLIYILTQGEVGV